jgi:D-alanyl-D-alanine carboxypeptidase/D-alanyl-D-alanine-endopeptidase (penicillin-binding protein 4)
MAARGMRGYTPAPMIQTSPARLAAALLVGAVAAAAAVAEPLPPRLQQAIRAADVPVEDVSIVVRDTVTGEEYLEVNPRVPRSPASTLKVVTTYAALDELGPAYTWKTRAYATGPIVAGRLQGDLVIQGGGDPFLTSERWAQFARELRNLGLQRIEGDIVLDRTLFAPQSADPDEFDGRGYRTYNVLPDPLLVNLQSADFHFVPRPDGIGVVLDPQPANLRLTNGIRVSSAGCRGGLRGVTFTSFDDDPGRLALGGRLSSRCPHLSVRRVIMEPASFAYGTFVTNWRQGGGELRGGLKLAPRPPDARLLLEYESLSLGEVVRLVNKYSSNAMARTLVLTLGLERQGAPASVEKGEAAMKTWLARRGLDAPELVIDNGSGLSRRTRITADSLARVLASAYQSRWYPELAASLPLGGLDGTLRTRFVDLGDSGRIRLKTGHLNSVAAVAGWVTGRAGRPLTVVVMVNHPGAQFASGDQIIDAVVRWTLER